MIEIAIMMTAHRVLAQHIQISRKTELTSARL